MKIGKRIFYDPVSLEILRIIEDMEGDIRDLSLAEYITVYSLPADTEEIRLGFGEYSDEFNQAGRIEIQEGSLIFFPRPDVNVDKETILSDGIDEAIITIQLVEDGDVTIHTTDGSTFVVGIVNGVGSFCLSSDIEGRFVFEIASEKYGKNSVGVEVVQNA
jgi:hypothetical protein